MLIVLKTDLYFLVIEVSSGEYGKQYFERMVKDIDSSCPLISDSNKHDDLAMNLDFKPEDINIKLLKAKSTDWDQFYTLLKRNFKQIFRNKTHLKLKFYMHIFLGLLVGTMFYNMGNDGSKTLYNFGFCFTVIIAFMYIPLMPILLECKSFVHFH